MEQDSPISPDMMGTGASNASDDAILPSDDAILPSDDAVLSSDDVCMSDVAAGQDEETAHQPSTFPLPPHLPAELMVYPLSGDPISIPTQSVLLASPKTEDSGGSPRLGGPLDSGLQYDYFVDVARWKWLVSKQMFSRREESGRTDSFPVPFHKVSFVFEQSGEELLASPPEFSWRAVSERRVRVRDQRKREGEQLSFRASTAVGVPAAEQDVRAAEQQDGRRGRGVAGAGGLITYGNFPRVLGAGREVGGPNNNNPPNPEQQDETDDAVLSSALSLTKDDRRRIRVRQQALDRANDYSLHFCAKGHVLPVEDLPPPEDILHVLEKKVPNQQGLGVRGSFFGNHAAVAGAASSPTVVDPGTSSTVAAGHPAPPAPQNAAPLLPQPAGLAGSTTVPPGGAPPQAAPPTNDPAGVLEQPPQQSVLAPFGVEGPPPAGAPQHQTAQGPTVVPPAVQQPVLAGPPPAAGAGVAVAGAVAGGGPRPRAPRPPSPPRPTEEEFRELIPTPAEFFLHVKQLALDYVETRDTAGLAQGCYSLLQWAQASWVGEFPQRLLDLSLSLPWAVQDLFWIQRSNRGRHRQTFCTFLHEQVSGTKDLGPVLIVAHYTIPLFSWIMYGVEEVGVSAQGVG